MESITSRSVAYYRDSTYLPAIDHRQTILSLRNNQRTIPDLTTNPLLRLGQPVEVIARADTVQNHVAIHPDGTAVGLIGSSASVLYKLIDQPDTYLHSVPESYSYTSYMRHLAVAKEQTGLKGRGYAKHFIPNRNNEHIIGLKHEGGGTF